MATDEQRLQLRRMTGEVDSDTYTEQDLDDYIAIAADDLDAAAARIWGEKASAYADLVDITESGSSRKNSDLFKHATQQQAYFEGLSDTGAAAAVPATTTRRIVRL